MTADLTQLFHQYYGPLVRMLYRRTGDRDRAEDLAQETFARAVTAPPDNPRPWLFAVALNLVREDGRLGAFRPQDVVVSAHRPEGSARHVWHGRVAGVAPHGDAVRLLVRGPLDLLADVTPASVVELGLAPGRDAWLSVKETAMTWYSDRDGAPTTITP